MSINTSVAKTPDEWAISIKNTHWWNLPTAPKHGKVEEREEYLNLTDKGEPFVSYIKVREQDGHEDERFYYYMYFPYREGKAQFKAGNCTFPNWKPFTTTSRDGTTTKADERLKRLCEIREKESRAWIVEQADQGEIPLNDKESLQELAQLIRRQDDTIQSQNKRIEKLCADRDQFVRLFLEVGIEKARLVDAGILEPDANGRHSSVQTTASL